MESEALDKTVTSEIYKGCKVLISCDADGCGGMAD